MSNDNYGSILMAFMISSAVFMFVFTISMAILASKDKEKEEKYSRMLQVGAGLFIIGFFMGMIFLFMWGIFENEVIIPAIIVIAIIVIEQLISKLPKAIKNKAMKMKVTDEQIYIRDVPADYSPAILSYLVNQKIERRKDFVASVLNLVAKKVMDVEILNSGEILIKEGSNKNRTKLPADEKYLYYWMTGINKEGSIAEWEKYVIYEYDAYGFTKKSKSKVNKAVISFVLFIIVVMAVQAFGANDIFQLADANSAANLTSEEISETISNAVDGTMRVSAILFFSFFGILITNGITGKLEKGFNGSDIYTKIGALEMSRWSKFKKFLKEYTLVSGASPESVIILEQYLAYGMALGVNKEYNNQAFDSLKSLLKYNILDVMESWMEQKEVKE